MEFVTDPTLESLASAVADQIAALGHLQFKFEVQQMMLVGGRGTWVDETTRDLELAIQAVHRADLVFRQSLLEAARSVDLSPESTLREVANVVGEPWSYIFSQGREELRKAVARIDELSAENRKLLARAYFATAEALAMLGVNTNAAYDANGAPVTTSPSIILNAKA